MYAVKIPSYTKGFKLNGHLFQIYHIIEEDNYSGHVRYANCDYYIDYEKKQKKVTKAEAFYTHKAKNPNIDDISIPAWSGSSNVVYFDKLDDAVVFKALINRKAKQVIFDKLDKIKESVNKQTKKIDIANEDIIEKYPEYFL